jgi:hypothetical protein
MYLTREEERILDGERGEGLRKAMELLVALGEIKGAERLIPVASAQVSGVSYKTIGEAGLEFLRSLASTGVKAQVMATLNPAGVDLLRWRELGFSEGFAAKQLEIIEVYRKMGILPSCTCTPYLAGNLPARGESVSWAESSAVVFANSVLRARTNRESGVSALASALTGKTPYYGLHLAKNRDATFRVKVKAELKSEADYSALGYYIGKHYEGIPVFDNIKAGLEELKALAAALGVGGISMFRLRDENKLETVSFDEEELKATYEELNTAEEADVICIGCPHCSLRELHGLIKLRPRREVWAFTGRQNMLIKDSLQGKIRLISDTCMVVAPLEELGINTIGVNSAKAAFYSANLSKLGVRFDSMENLLR